MQSAIDAVREKRLRLARSAVHGTLSLKTVSSFVTIAVLKAVKK